jgi:hypothetical protein
MTQNSISVSLERLNQNLTNFKRRYKPTNISGDDTSEKSTKPIQTINPITKNNYTSYDTSFPNNIKDPDNPLVSKQIEYEICIDTDVESLKSHLEHIGEYVENDQNFVYGTEHFKKAPDEVALYLSLARLNLRDGIITKTQFRMMHFYTATIYDSFFQTEKKNVRCSKNNPVLENLIRDKMDLSALAGTDSILRRVFNDVIEKIK